MDKTQKQLYKTYYRKRNLAAREDEDSYGYKDYEIDFGAKNKLINPDNFNHPMSRAPYYNAIWGTDYKEVNKFGAFGDDAVIVSNKNHIPLFVNRKGELDVTGIDIDKIDDVISRAAYYNVIWGTDHKNVYKFGEYGGDVTWVIDKNNNMFFLNKHGKLDVTGIDPNKLKPYMDDSYMNTKALIAKQNG